MEGGWLQKTTKKQVGDQPTVDKHKSVIKVKSVAWMCVFISSCNEKGVSLGDPKLLAFVRGGKSSASYVCGV